MIINYVIPNYENPQLLERCISHIRKFSKNKIIVCDDNSSSESLEKISEICNQENVKLITNFWNSGFGYSCNRGINISEADVCILVNSDVFLSEDIEKETRRILKSDPKIGVIGFLLYYPNGLIQHGGHIAYNEDYRVLGHRGYRQQLKDAPEVTKSGYILSVTGALMAIRKDMINKIGGFKKEYTFSCEDNELCFRAWHTGFRVYYSGNVSAVHAEGITRGATGQEKQNKRTFHLEQQTIRQYISDIALYDFKEINRQINIAKGVSVMDRPKRIGIIREGALGDCVLATGIVNEMKRRNPEAEIYIATLCVYPFAVNPNVKKIFNDKRKMIEQVDELYDLDLAYERKPKLPVVEAYAQVCFDSYISTDIKPTLNSVKEAREKVLEDVYSSLQNKKVAVVHAGMGFWESKHWEKEKWNELSNRLKEIGYEVITVGSGKDHVLDNSINLVDKLKLTEVFEVIKFADLFIGIDGGISHIASCTDTPMVVLYSVADPNCFVSRWDNTIVIEPETECKYCRNEVVPPVTGVVCKYGDNRCIKSITVDSVIDGVNLLKGETI